MRWRKQRHGRPEELKELDPFLLSMIERLASARAEAHAEDGEWVALDQVATLTARMAEAAQSALVAGWDQDAESRMLVERRSGPAGVEVRLTRTAREFLGPVLGGGTGTVPRH